MGVKNFSLPNLVFSLVKTEGETRELIKKNFKEEKL
jgi:hypothetical protein